MPNGSKKIIDLAIVIPTLNEEHYIGRLLDSIAKQDVKPREIIVVDAYSKDKTIKEIKKRQETLPGLRVFRIPRRTISRQRNLGAQKTLSHHLLFLDADMEIKGRSDLKKYFEEVIKLKPDVASARNLPDVNHWKDLVFFKAENLLVKVLKYFWPVITARNLYVKRAVFNEAGGFNEEIPVGEDQELVQRIVKRGGKLEILKGVNLYTSTRRIQKEGRRKYALKVILFGLNIMLRGHKKSRVTYEFGNFSKPLS